MVDERGRVERIPDELCALVSLRDALRRREIWVRGRTGGGTRRTICRRTSSVNPYGRFELDMNAHLESGAAAAAAKVTGPRPVPGVPTAQSAGGWAGSV
ncbi:hypothetical protein [Streptomyces sp. NPDC002550]